MDRPGPRLLKSFIPMRFPNILLISGIYPKWWSKCEKWSSSGANPFVNLESPNPAAFHGPGEDTRYPVALVPSQKTIGRLLIEVCQFSRCRGLSSAQRPVSAVLLMGQLGNRRRGLIGVRALVAAAVHRSGHVVVDRAGGHRAIGVGQARNQRCVDLDVARPRRRRTVDVIPGDG
jgi:hypothetical protein